jgi:hypothetical protein
MTRRLRAVLLTSVALVAALSLVAPVVAGACECDSPYVRHHGAVIEVRPTHRDDTANLRCALRVAQREPGHTIELTVGQFWTRQLWATGFVGTIKGQGADKTILSNRGPLTVSPGDDVLMKPPSASNLWPSFLTFVDGAFTVADLGIRMKGPLISTGYSFFGSWSPNNIISEITVTGKKAEASFERLAIEGPLVDEGANAPWGDILAIMYQPTLGGYANTLTGRFDVIGCSFTKTGLGFNAGVVEHAQITWHANTVTESGAGFEIWDAAHTIVQATGNRLDTNGIAPLYSYPSPYPAIGVGYWTFTGLGLKETSVYVTDNQVTGPLAQAGLWILPFASDTARIFAAGNVFTGTTGTYLGSDSKGVIVKRDGAPVVDDGTGNYVLAP